jgi:modulator of FtsH protease
MWTNFFIAAAGASAALAGLVIVAMSVNINRILQHPHLPSRAGATVGTLILILVSSMAALIPQNPRILGMEIISFAAGCWYLEVSSARKAVAARVQWQRPRFESVLETALGQIQVLPFLIGGIALVEVWGGGLYWVASGVITIFIASTLNAWVLLVEILR